MLENRLRQLNRLDRILRDLEVCFVAVLGEQAADLSTVVLAQVRRVMEECEDLVDGQAAFIPVGGGDGFECL